MVNTEQSLKQDWIITFMKLLGLNKADGFSSYFSKCVIIYVLINMPENPKMFQSGVFFKIVNSRVSSFRLWIS